MRTHNDTRHWPKRVRRKRHEPREMHAVKTEVIREFAVNRGSPRPTHFFSTKNRLRQALRLQVPPHHHRHFMHTVQHSLTATFSCASIHLSEIDQRWEVSGPIFGMGRQRLDAFPCERADASYRTGRGADDDMIRNEEPRGACSQG